MKALCCFIVMFCFCIKNYAQYTAVPLAESTVIPVIDGELLENEWLDAKEIVIKGIIDRAVTVLLTYDAEHLYVAFKNLTDSNSINYNAEVLIQTNIESHTWDEHSYWFHSSYSNCAAIGQYYYWDDCSTEPMGWMANTFPFKDGNDTIEFKISFSKLNISPKKGEQLKMAFKLSNPLEQHVYWPETATIANPESWGIITFN